MPKYAWTWHIKQEFLDEYVRMHLNPWPELLREHEIAGFKNYSIFQHGDQFFYCFESDNVKKAFEYVANSDICRKWNDITSKMVIGSFDFATGLPEFLPEVFYMA